MNHIMYQYRTFVHFKNLAQSVEIDENIDCMNCVNDFEKQSLKVHRYCF